MIEDATKKDEAPLHRPMIQKQILIIDSVE